MYIQNKKDIDFVNTKFLDFKYKLITKYSESETHFEKLLKESGLFYTREKCNFKLNTKWCYYDFYIPRLRLYVEIDGSEHKVESKRSIDNEKFKFIRRKGCFMIRFTNEKVLNMIYVNKGFLLAHLFYLVKKSIYDKSIKFNRNNQKEDIMNMYGDSLYSGVIYFYSQMSGQYYMFDDIFQCCIRTGFKAAYIIDLLSIEYKKSSSRLYVASKTLSECELNVMKVFG